MSEERCRNCGGLLGSANAGCLTCGLVRTPTLPPEVVEPSKPPEFEVPNFGFRVWRAILPDFRTRRIHVLFFSIVGGCTYIGVLVGIDAVLSGEGWGEFASRFFTCFFVGLGFGITLVPLIGPFLVPDSDELEAEETVGDVLNERIRQAHKKRKRLEEEGSSSSTGITAQCPLTAPEHVERPRDGLP